MQVIYHGVEIAVRWTATEDDGTPILSDVTRIDYATNRTKNEAGIRTLVRAAVDARVAAFRAEVAQASSRPTPPPPPVAPEEELEQVEERIAELEARRDELTEVLEAAE